MRKHIVFVCCALLMLGCTGKMNASEIATALPSPDSGNSPSLPDTSSPVVMPDAPISAPVIVATPAPLSQEFMKPEAAQAKVEEIVQAMNADPQYQINNDDFSFLKSEGLVDDSNEIKGWVK